MSHNLKAAAVPNCTLKSTNQRDKETTRKTCHNLSAIKITTGIFLERSDEYNTVLGMFVGGDGKGTLVAKGTNE